MAMSLIQDAYACTQALSVGERAVYVALATVGDDKTRCSWPSQETLSEMTGLHARTVRKIWRALEDAGLIRWATPEEDPYSGGGKTICWYLTPGLRPGEEALTPGVDTPALTPGTPGLRPSPPAVRPAYTSSSGGGTFLRKGTSSTKTRSSKITNTTLLNHFQQRLNYAQDELGAKVFGAAHEVALRACFNRLRDKQGFSNEFILRMIDTYTENVDRWSKVSHPSNDFCRNDTVTWVSTFVENREAAEYSDAGSVRDEVIEDSVISYEEAKAEYLRKQAEQAPSWERKEQAQ